MKKTIITVLITVAVMSTFAQRSKPKVKDTSYTKNSVQFAPFKEIIVKQSWEQPFHILGFLNNDGHWDIRDTIGLLNNMLDRIKKSKINQQTERRLAYKFLIAVNSRNIKQIKSAAHNYAKFIRTHQ